MDPIIPSNTGDKSQPTSASVPTALSDISESHSRSLLSRDFPREERTAPAKYSKPLSDSLASHSIRILPNTLDESREDRLPWFRTPSSLGISGRNQTYDSSNHTMWRDEAQTTSQNLIIKNGGNLTLTNCNLTLVGTQGTTNSSQFSLLGPDNAITFIYYRWSPGLAIKVSVSWEVNPDENLIDARIYSAQDYPNSTVGVPDEVDSLPGFDLSRLGLVSDQGSPEGTIFHVPENMGNLFFIAIYAVEDGTAIQGDVTVTAVNTASLIVEDGGTLKVEKGSRLASSDESIAGAGIFLIENGANVIFEDSLITNYTMLHIEDNQAIIRNVTFRGNRHYDLLTVVNTGLLIENCSFISGHNGITAISADDFRFHNNTIWNCTSDAIAAISSSGIIRNNIVWHSRFGAFLGTSTNLTFDQNILINCNNGILLWRSTSGVLKDNIVQNSTYYAIRLYLSNNSRIISNHVTNSENEGIFLQNSENISLSSNFADSCSNYGIFLDRTVNSTVSGNTVTQSGISGIYLESSLNITASANVVNRSIGVIWDYGDGICLHNTSSSAILDNFLDKNRVVGIRLELFSSNNRVVNNTVFDNQDWEGIILLDNSNDNELVNNTVFNINNHGIMLEGSHNNILANNKAFGNSLAGFMLNYADNNKLVNNSAFDNDGHGIRLEYSNDNILSTNIATNNSDGINLLSSNNNNILRNQAYNSAAVGIHLRPASHNFVSNNTVDHSGAQGIYVGESGFNNISENRVTNTIFSGIVLHSSNNHILSQNIVSHNGAEGIVLERSDYNSILDNVISNNGDYGVSLKIWWGEGPDPCFYNLVKWNTFIGHPEGLSQAFDDGKENIFAYNYWDDWIQPDADTNGIVDHPYPIDLVPIVGDPLTRNQDPYPLVHSFSFTDSDGDGMDDLYESTMGLDPNADDSTSDLDQDELLNLAEYQLGTKANDPDSDNDGLEDGFEVQMGLNPLVNDAASDLDGDGMPNLWEVQMGLNLADSRDAVLDLDEDGLSNLEEYHLGLNATASDTDADKLPDNWEVAMGLNGADPQDALQDPDGDGLNNLQEYQAGTDPHNPDSDSDFFPDGVDYGWWGNPRRNWDNPLTRGLLALLLGVLAGLCIWAGFIAFELPKLQLELKRQLQQIQQQMQQFNENIKAINSSKSLQELGETSKGIHQDFDSCRAALKDAQSLVTRKWIPSFISPDLTPLKMLTNSLNATYTQFTQEYLKHVEILMDE